MKENIAKGSSAFSTPLALQKSMNVSRDVFSGQRTTIAKICEEGKILLDNIFLLFSLIFALEPIFSLFNDGFCQII